MGCSSSRGVNTIDEEKNKNIVDIEIENEILPSKMKSSPDYINCESKCEEKFEQENLDQHVNRETVMIEQNEIIPQAIDTNVIQTQSQPQNAVFFFEEVQPPEYQELQMEDPVEIQYQPLEKPENSTEIILNQLQTFINDHKIPNDAINIRVCKSVILEKEENDKFEIRETTKFSFVGAKKKIKWNKKEFSHLIDDVTKYFNQSQLHDNFGFEWTSYLLENEKENLDTKLRKYNPTKEKFEDVELDTSASEKVKVILIFSLNDAVGINKIKEINDYKELDREFDFYPIFGLDIKKKEEALENINFMSTLGVKDSELYFFKKSKDKQSDLHKRINYVSDDNKKEIISTAVVFDKNGYVRYVGNPEGLLVENLKSYSDNDYFDEKQYLKSKDYMLNQIEENSEAVGSGSFTLAKTELYDSNLNLLNVFYERKIVDVNTHDQLFEQLFSHLKFDFNNVKSKVNKFKNKAESLNSHVSHILSKMEISLKDIVYSGAVSVIKRYHIALPKKMKKFRMCCDKKRFTSLQFNLISELFEQLRAPLLDHMGQLRLNPILDKIKSVSISPFIDSKFPQSINLIHSEEKNEIQINLSENSPKLFIIIKQCKNSDHKAEVTQHLSKIWNNISSKDGLGSQIEIFLIYTGDSSDEARELIDDSFPQQIIYLLNSSITSNFPYSTDNEGPTMLVIINNSENITRYIGTASDISITQTLSNLASGNDEISYKPNYPMTYQDYKENFKKKLKELFQLIEDSFLSSEHHYKPIIEYSLTKECQYNNEGLVNTYCKDIRVKILMKKISENLLTGHEGIKRILKSMQKEWGVSVKVLKIPCVDLLIDEKICVICKEQIKGEFTYDNQEEVNEFFYDQEKSLTYCADCERGLKHHTTNLIYLKYLKENEIILSEVIQGFYEMNIMARSHLENTESLACSICNSSFNGHHVVWMSLIHLNHVADYEEEITRPVILCDRKCFPFLQENQITKKTINYILHNSDLTKEEKKFLRRCAIDRNNLIFKKIILPNDLVYL